MLTVGGTMSQYPASEARNRVPLCRSGCLRSRATDGPLRPLARTYLPLCARRVSYDCRFAACRAAAVTGFSSGVYATSQ
jgi:hypothetical protein